MFAIRTRSRDRTRPLLVGCGQDRLISFFLSLFLPVSRSPASATRRIISPLCSCSLLCASLTTHLLVRLLLSYFLNRPLSPFPSLSFLFFSLSLRLTLPLPRIINIAVRCRYLHNPVDSISGGLSRARARRGTEQNRARTALGQRQRI